MTSCLLHQNTFKRNEANLQSVADGRVDFHLLQDDGAVVHAETGDVIDAPDPNIVFGNADVWFGPQARLFFKFVLEASDLKWFQSAAAGVDLPALQAVAEKAQYYTTNHTQSEAMAEWAIWQALDWMKRGPDHRENERSGIWERLDQREIMGSTWLIVGYGAIGQAVARRARALGAYTVGVRRRGGEDEHADEMITPDELLPALGRADVVLLSLPLTEATENMANADFFAAMKSNALFMNLGRGKLVDEAALIAELDTGKPAHAALDVTATEPLPDASPLWHHPKITITPHDSSMTWGTVLRADETFLRNLGRYLDGKPLLHVLK